jgi:hypothetical protein
MSGQFFPYEPPKSKTKTYSQCTLRKTLNLNEYLEVVSWIPTEFVHLGNILKLKNNKGEWSDGWNIIHIGNTEEGNLVEYEERVYKRHRKMTDVKKGTFK